MSQMVRKQIYIQKSQEERLKKVAEAQGISEAEVIRRALDVELRHAGYRLPYDPEAWQRLVESWKKLDAQGPVEPRPRNWTREELYEERLSRYDKRSD